MDAMLPEDLSSCRIAIIGLGLMGGSMAMALKGTCRELIGIDTDERTLELARESQIVDSAYKSAEDVLPSADLVILATPVCTILSLIDKLPQLHPGSAIVLDLGSTKEKISTKLGELPERFDPVGGHPICGREKASFENAVSSLYYEATFVLTALQNTTPRAKRIVEQLVRKIGATPIWLKASDHDRWIAATSHFPHLIAMLSVLNTPPEAVSLIGPGFRSVTRLAGSSPDMILDMLMTNRENILAKLVGFNFLLSEMENCLVQSDFEKAKMILQMGSERYNSLVHS